jgi:hypothetical protein
MRPFDGDRCRKPDRHHGHAARHVDHEMVGRGHDRDGHCERGEDSEGPDGHVSCRPEEHHADEDVPSDIQAREGGVLIGEPNRLQRPVRARLLGDGVHEAEVE